METKFYVIVPETLNPNKKLLLNKKISLEVEMSDTNEKIFNFLTKTSYFYA